MMFGSGLEKKNAHSLSYTFCIVWNKMNKNNKINNH